MRPEYCLFDVAGEPERAAPIPRRTGIASRPRHAGRPSVARPAAAVGSGPTALRAPTSQHCTESSYGTDQYISHPLDLAILGHSYPVSQVRKTTNPRATCPGEMMTTSPRAGRYARGGASFVTIWRTLCGLSTQLRSSAEPGIRWRCMHDDAFSGHGGNVAEQPGRETRSPAIVTPDRRLRVFISSTIEELAPERRAAREAIAQLRQSAVFFEAGARPHPPQRRLSVIPRAERCFRRHLLAAVRLGRSR